jgi:hypothetical protein
MALLRGWLKFQCFPLSCGRQGTAEHPSWRLTTQKPLLLRHKTKELSIIKGSETTQNSVQQISQTYIFISKKCLFLMQSYLLRETELSFPVIVIHILQKEFIFTLLSKHKERKMHQENRKRNQLISNLNT